MEKALTQTEEIKLLKAQLADSDAIIRRLNAKKDRYRNRLDYQTDMIVGLLGCGYNNIRSLVKLDKYATKLDPLEFGCGSEATIAELNDLKIPINYACVAMTMAGLILDKIFEHVPELAEDYMAVDITGFDCAVSFVTDAKGLDLKEKQPDVYASVLDFAETMSTQSPFTSNVKFDYGVE